MNKDWLFSKENFICNFRAVGILLRGNKLLVQREKGGAEYALPGGHVKIGETAEQTLIREYKEETGADIICRRLAWVEEACWKWGEKDTHGIAFYYLVSLKNNSDIPDQYFESQKDNCNIILQWVTTEEIKQLKIYPAIVKDKIENLSENIEHFVRVE